MVFLVQFHLTPDQTRPGRKISFIQKLGLSKDFERGIPNTQYQLLGLPCNNCLLGSVLRLLGGGLPIMPTPVAVARQCLAKEAAAALDDAIAVAKCRKHAQTTSLHVVSALLALPSSLLRDACTRSRNVAYSQRLQFRALELCVGVALDRVLVSKTAGDEPPVSNSLMAAIKRSQANQRRHPETFLLYQQQLSSNPDSPPSISAVKVELKHFVMSILDDPIVSRVFGDAGFQTQEMKFTILSPPSVSRFLSTFSRPLPPQFSSGWSDYKQSKLASNFPFLLDDSDAKVSGNTKRISHVLLKPNRRNPLLIGACAGDAYASFLDSLKNDPGILSKEGEGLSLVSLEHEVSEFLAGRLSEATIDSKLKRFGEKTETERGPRTVAHCGDLISLVNAESVDLVSCLVTKLKNSLVNSCGRLWIIGFLGGDDVYKRLLERVPSLESDWDLNLLPITSSTIGAKCSLMRTFVPFGGLFAAPPPLELGTTPSGGAQTAELCDWCNEKFEQEISAVQKGESLDSFADKQSESSSSSWLRIGKMSNAVLEIKEGKSVFDARVAALRRKWGDICQKLHSFPSVSSSKNCRLPESHQNFADGSLKGAAAAQNLDLNAVYQQSLVVPVVSTCLNSVATDLRLGTTHRGFPDENRNSNATGFAFSSSHLDKQMCGKQLEGPWNALAEKVFWQMDAIRAVNRAVTNWIYKDNKTSSLWLTFLGPDKVGKWKTAALLSEIVFGPTGNFVCLDLSMGNGVVPSSDSILDRYHSKLRSLKPGRKLVIDCIADDLRRHPNSVVLLENIDKADILIQESLSLAIKTGKFRDSFGRIINIQGTILVLESNNLKLTPPEQATASEFSWEEVIAARTLPMQLSFRSSTALMPANVRITRDESQRNKRKMVMDNEQHSPKRPSRSYIDLNVPLLDTEAEMDTPPGSMDEDEGRGSLNDSDSSSSASSSLSWLHELLEHVEENVVFKPYDFDSAAHEAMRTIEPLMQEVGMCLEIDERVMFQILAAAWLAEEKKALGVWIEQILRPSVGEARRRYSSCSSSSEVVMKLEHDPEGSAIEEQVQGLCLPLRIHIS